MWYSQISIEDLITIRKEKDKYKPDRERGDYNILEKGFETILPQNNKGPRLNPLLGAVSGVGTNYSN